MIGFYFWNYKIINFIFNFSIYFYFGSRDKFI